MQSLRNASDLPAKQVDVPLRTMFVDSTSAKLAVCFARIPFFLHRWRVILGSLREHIRIQFAIQSVSLGPGFELLDTCWQENKRTTARAEGIKRLQAIRRTVDIADIQMFLAGFDAGELYALDYEGSQMHSNQDAEHIQQEPQDSSC